LFCIPPLSWNHSDCPRGGSGRFHTRLQHTIKVAQVGRRLAQHVIHSQAQIAQELGVDVEVVEAACLAHDLGHPPFGHAGEHVLNTEVERHGDPDGFEGNAQSFRILTKLAVRFDERPGLDLTRATLAACLKYPWFRDKKTSDRSKKWGAYKSEKDDFDFARDGIARSSKTTEADLMDWADDVAYSVHDLEDFHRCAAVPWHRILGGDHADQLISRADKDWFGKPANSTRRLRKALTNLEELLRGSFLQLITEPYDGARHQRQQLRTMTSQLIGRYIRAVRLQKPDKNQKTVVVNGDATDQVLILKQITKDYIINNPSLAAQQKGQEHLLKVLFKRLHKDSKGGPPDYLPHRLRYLWDYASNNRARFVADCIASLTEAEAVALHARLRGRSSGSVLDPIVR
jgi:dGTPase